MNAKRGIIVLGLLSAASSPTWAQQETQKIDGVQAKDADQVIALQPDEQQLKEVTVTAVERRNTDAAMIQVAKNSPVIVSNVSAQEISRTQDTNAGEVIRRVPGVSLIDDKFVMVRGLSQRYNNVWVNGGAMLNFTFLSKDGNHKYQLKKIYYKQFAEVTYADGSKREVEEISRCYKPGRNIGLSASYKF